MRVRMFGLVFVGWALLMVSLVEVGILMENQRTKSSTPRPTHTTTRVKQSKITFKYSSCAQARQAGASPLLKGEPGYNPRLDRDRDGVACD